MSSQKRRDASRKNGALGGPKSPEGKKKSSQNARKAVQLDEVMDGYNEEIPDAPKAESKTWHPRLTVLKLPQQVKIIPIGVKSAGHP